MKNVLKLLMIVFLSCNCVGNLNAMDQRKKTTSEQVDQWKEQTIKILNNQLTAVKRQIFQLQNDISAKDVNLKIPLLEWKAQLLGQEKQLIDSYKINNSKENVFLLLKCIQHIDRINEDLHNLLTNQVKADNLSLAKQAVKAKQNLQRISPNHPVQRNFDHFSEFLILYAQSNDEQEKARILEEMNNLKNQVDQM